ncbi:hypothetical protein HVY96_22790 [Escherichia fergusonii]|uniref:hypothetical protein n=1 Tax=Escherichia fergusonii TaxID=564 RepID=UPI0006144F8F|nr:hypothetical protein [Escherichia fergusonii]EFL4495079.1 hypothetical protein [Escherichia fergusonii]EHG6159410.1 hypothetical protein [Escherichia fergusonii]EHK3065784.1 hypothetical protein [Escherichia fergusonii]EHK3070556.1 hypothetical protein [Escherichia fergusonii]EIQ6794834.1 hypothetical protein [Escherichia fergusonii]
MDEIFIHLPKHLIRYETGQAIDSLAQRFSLPYEPSMQDWPIEVADKQRLDEFLSAYSECNDDECFVLMIILLECIDSFGEQYYKHPSWSVIYDLLDTHITRHIYTVWYWSCTDYEDEELEDAFYITSDMRALLKKHAYLLR